MLTILDIFCAHHIGDLMCSLFWRISVYHVGDCSLYVIDCGLCVVDCASHVVDWLC